MNMHQHPCPSERASHPSEPHPSEPHSSEPYPPEPRSCEPHLSEPHSPEPRFASRDRKGAVGRFTRLLLSFLRELSDENAYRRHLAAHGAEPSAAEWRRFSEERLRAKYARAKCC